MGSKSKFFEDCCSESCGSDNEGSNDAEKSASSSSSQGYVKESKGVVGVLPLGRVEQIYGGIHLASLRFIAVYCKLGGL